MLQALRERRWPTAGLSARARNSLARSLAASMTRALYPLAMPDMQKDVDDAARQPLNALLTEDDRVDLHATAVVCTAASPATAIVEDARDARVGVIVVGTHGRGGMSHLLLGSVADRVGRTAHCPVSLAGTSCITWTAP